MKKHSILMKQYEVLVAIKELLQTEKDLLLHGTSEEIIRFIERKEELQISLRRLESDRLEQMELSQVTELESTEMEKLRQQMRLIVEEIQQLNEESQVWNQIALNYKRDEIEQIQRLLEGDKSMSCSQKKPYSMTPQTSIVKCQL